MVRDPSRHPRAFVALACASAAFLTFQYASTSRLHEYLVNDAAGGTRSDVERHRTLIMMSEETHEEEGELPAILREEAAYDFRTIPHPLSVRGGDEGEGNDHAAEDEDEIDTGIMTHTRLINKRRPLPRYNIEDAVRTSRMYDNTYALLVYDPEKDAFYMLYSKRHYFVHSVYKLINSFDKLTHLLRRIFPERFLGVQSDELVIPISSGDYPAVKVQCLDHFRGKGRKQTWRDLIASKAKATCGDGNPAPILHFGSFFRQPHMFPNMIGMPMPSPEHLYCMEKWVIHRIVCKDLRSHSAADDRGRLVYGEELGLTWEVSLFVVMSKDRLNS